jgi:hypothetical protein
MERQVVESKLAKSVGYDGDLAVLEVEFHNGGTYQYPGVTPEEIVELMTAKSFGSYFLKNIKPKYKGVKAPLELEAK